MTDKQIIIDGVDVSGCEFFRSETLEDFRGDIYSFKYCNEITEVEDCSSPYECSDKERTDCYYKQLKRAEQKLAKIKEILETYYDDDWKATREIEKIIEGKENG